MPNQQYSTFLPSGALELSRPPNMRHYSDSVVSPRSLAPRGSAINRTGSPNCIPGIQGSGSNSSYMSPLTSPPARHASSPFASHLHQSSNLASPPISRSGSSDGGATAALIEDWRSFTRKLREQFATERTNMQESRIRSEEVMAEERALWDKERTFYEARIADLEAQLANFTGPLSLQSQRQEPRGSYFPSIQSRIPQPQHISLPKSTQSNSGNSTAGARSVDSCASKAASIASHVPQESGLKCDGSFFYAPVSQPTRTFDPSPSSEARVDSVHVPGETPLHVTSKELTAADFLSPPPTGSGLVSPNRSSRSGSVVGGDSIDISLLAPGLEGVPIRKNAVEPTFVAHIMSPQGTSTAQSPTKLSPDVNPPPRPVQNYDLSSPESKRRGSHGSINFERRGSAGSLGSSKGSPKRCGPKKTLEIIKQPHERRLTMHAGHTPNHSVINFELGDSGLTTPKASKINKEMESELAGQPREDVHVLPEGQSCKEERLRDANSFEDSGDYELTGPLGLKNEAEEDDIFLKTLTSKLEEVKEKEAHEVSITTTEAEEEDDEMPDQEVMKMALNAIGRGLGSGSMRGGDGVEDDDVLDSVPDDVPILRLKPSVNFGRPLGSL